METPLKTHARLRRIVSYTQLCEPTGWGRNLSPTIWFHKVEMFEKRMHDLRGKFPILHSETLGGNTLSP